jgi:hypothetical protein
LGHGAAAHVFDQGERLRITAFSAFGLALLLLHTLLFLAESAEMSQVAAAAGRDTSQQWRIRRA